MTDSITSPFPQTRILLCIDTHRMTAHDVFLLRFFLPNLFVPCDPAYGALSVKAVWETAPLVKTEDPWLVTTDWCSNAEKLSTQTDARILKKQHPIEGRVTPLLRFAAREVAATDMDMVVLFANGCEERTAHAINAVASIFRSSARFTVFSNDASHQTKRDSNRLSFLAAGGSGLHLTYKGQSDRSLIETMHLIVAIAQAPQRICADILEATRTDRGLENLGAAAAHYAI